MEDYGKSEFAEQFRNRTKRFVIDVIEIYRKLPRTVEAQIIGKQLLRSASSVGANYRAACRARSQAEFYSKICIVIEEADESLFWMEILVESNIVDKPTVMNLMIEGKEILKVVSSARKTISSKIDKTH
ncbi:four helix bundle protein [Mucilaginibacter galii]|uniref:Four helix bundle protein n=1 Tax=Mucilaginibacter galii TaxID=2005073 RepID=A0A917JAL2_9SPHI|nr:four helix bundle protein [Mucilaginibacter galii]GGI50189.1 four helix bundle protein [Mucilaginibacter galii]